MNQSLPVPPERRTLWDVSALVYASTYDDTAHGVDHDILSLLDSRLRNGVVLDAGCGPGVVVRKLLDRRVKKVVGVDISKKMLAQLPEDVRVTGVHADLTPEVIASVRSQFAPKGFRLVLFKRSLYQDPDTARSLLQSAFESLDESGAVVIIHPETNLEKYLLNEGSRKRWAVHTAYHAFNRAISRTLTWLRIHEYRTWDRDGLVELARSAAPDAKVEILPTKQRAFNVVAISRGGVL